MLANIISLMHDEKFVKKFNKISMMSTYALFALFILANTFVPAAAADFTSVVKGIIDFIGKLFVVIGIILLAYSVGQLILAFKNEDADAKTRATTQLVVAAALIAVPQMISALELESLIPKIGK